MSKRFRTTYDPVPREKVFCPPEENRTKSEFAADCDINQIMARYRKTGMLPEGARQAAARFGDFSQIPTYHEMHGRLLAAQDLFDALPSHVRKQFNNDPGAFIASADTVEGRELLVKLGLGAEAGLPPSPADPDPQGAAEPPKAPKGASKQKWKGTPPPASARGRLSEKYDLPDDSGQE